MEELPKNHSRIHYTDQWAFYVEDIAVLAVALVAQRNDKPPAVVGVLQLHMCAIGSIWMVVEAVNTVAFASG